MHISVLKDEVLKGLDLQENDNFIDATFHMGGHSELILQKTKGKILGIEIDEEVFKKAQKKFKNNERVILVNDSYAHLENIISESNFKNIKGILFDVGMSSWHIDESKRGFTFQKDEPLNMLFKSQGTSAEEIINKYSKDELEKVFNDYKESKKVVKAILKSRKEKKIKTTFELISALDQNYYSLAKIFQALRIEANKELDNLKKALPQALNVLEKQGRLLVISFHSGEDRIVKEFAKENKEKVIALNKKPIIPKKEEVMQNPRSRSAKLRILIKK
ncbi:MAG: 16S rRNA (cytosine(1402)-N(4))-methyltransferase RsmH [Candidatus Paceibacterota bacterium]